jgi:hypothetical protein
MNGKQIRPSFQDGLVSGATPYIKVTDGKAQTRIHRQHNSPNNIGE